MELSFLTFLQTIRAPWLDSAVSFIVKVIGPNCEIWIVLGIILLLIPKTRKSGVCVLVSFCISFFVNNLIVDLISRPAPFLVEPVGNMLMNGPQYSCPSLTATLSFATALSIFVRNKKMGIPLIFVSVLLCFCRMYLYLVYPTDVIFGAATGILIALAVYYLTKNEKTRRSSKK